MRYRSDGLYLGLETSRRVGSVAVARGNGVLAREVLEATRGHAAMAVPAIHRVLESGGVRARDLAGLIVGEGPGSFTGVRVAAATAKGMAYALDCPLWTFSSLTAAALPSCTKGARGVHYVLFDARGDRLYAACYGVGSKGVEELVAPHFVHLREALAGDVPPAAVFMGDGATRHRAAIEGAGFAVAPPSHGVPSADALVSLLSLNPESSPLESVGSWEPTYLRASSAERIARE